MGPECGYSKTNCDDSAAAIPKSFRREFGQISNLNSGRNRDMPLEVPEKLDHLGAFDAAGVDLEIEPPERQSADDRKAFPVEGLVQHRGLTARRPSANPGRAGAQSTFVDEDDGAMLLAGLFFKAGQSTRFHRRMAFSSRSMARRSGRWQLKPLAPSKRQT